nr:MAG TPA: Hemagglutinin HA2 Virus, GP2 Ectodomain, Post-Fusion [Caudoviricetes sp.]
MDLVKFQDFYTLFFDKIERDREFFMYNDIPCDKADEITKERAKSYLTSALSYLFLKCSSDIDFMNYDFKREVHNENLTNSEIDLIVSVMFEKYLERDISILKAQSNRFTTKDLNVFSPANERKTFMDMFKQIQDDNIKKIKDYEAIDRITGKLKSISS